MKRKGFTLVELLVVIAIIGVLVALLLPAVQAAREAARRASCSNNLKQVALAMHNYHDSFKGFPSGQYGLLQTNGRPNRSCWMQNILPFIEQQNLYDKFKPSMDANASATGWPGRDTLIEALMCPSDPNAGKTVTTHSAPAGQGFHGNYVMCAGSTLFGNSGQGSNLNGMFYCYSSSSFASATDGTAFTLMASEVLLTEDGGSSDFTGRYFNSWAGESLFSTRVGPNSTTPDVTYSDGCNNNTYAPCVGTGSGLAQYARSQHTGGAMTARMDGSVGFTTDSVSVNVFQALGTRNGGEPISE